MVRRLQARTVMKYLAPQRGEVVFDIGAGGGQYTVELARAGAFAVAIDINREFASEASKGLCLVAGATACVGDATCLPFQSGVADAVLLSGTIQNTDELAVLGECARILKPGGRAVVTGLEGHPSIVRFYARAGVFPIQLLIELCALPATFEEFVRRYSAFNSVLKYVDRERVSAYARELGLVGEGTAYVPGGVASSVIDLLHLFLSRSTHSWVQSRAAFVATFPFLSALQIIDRGRTSGGEWISTFRRTDSSVDRAGM
jgi:ubiquinone/menaquinone biosynthesis C-methylase UbiE